MGCDARSINLPPEIEVERLRRKRLDLRLREPSVDRHLREHEVAPHQRPLRVQHRVVEAGAFKHADQRGGLEHIQFLGRLVEIGARRHFDAVSIEEEGHGVEIGLENLVFGIDRLDLEGGNRLLDLSLESGGAADLLRIEVARKLLGDGGASLQVAGERVERCRDRSQRVDAVVPVEAVVLVGNQRIDHGEGDFVQRHPLPVDALEFGQHHAVGREEHRGRCDLGLLQVAGAGRVGNERQHPGHHEHRQHQGRFDRMTPDDRRQSTEQPAGKIGCALEDGSHPRSLRRWRPGFCALPHGRERAILEVGYSRDSTNRFPSTFAARSSCFRLGQ